MRVTFDDKSFFVDGKRIWLVCGEMHYFRIPGQLWEDRFKKAKENGINCISTYMAWNFHEQESDCYDFTGDADIEEYIRLAGEYGFYVILRPGPYICSEWDFGGFPAYLNTLSGIRLRTDNPVFQARYEKYFSQILPRLSKYDVEHGGNILLIQNENEHIMPGLKGREAYFEDINRIIRKSGFKIPIINCNRMFEGSILDMTECVNTWDEPLTDLKKMREVQPDKPLLITELWCGGCDSWGRAFARVSPKEVYKRILSILCFGAQYTYYMWHGGTNFSFWGGRLQYEKNFYMITSYDLDAPLSEGGIRSEKYYAAGLVNMLALSLGTELCEMRTEYSTDETKTLICAEKGEQRIKAVLYQEPNERTNQYGAAMFLENLLLKGHVVSSENFIPLWFLGTTWIFYGEPGQYGTVEVDGNRTACFIEEQPRSVTLCGIEILFMDTKTAKRYKLSEGKPVYESGDKTEKALPIEVRWEKLCTDNPENIKDWIRLDKPKSADELGIYYGYIWYRIELESKEECIKNIVFPYSEDRCLVYSSRHYIGAWGAGAGFEGIEVSLKAGKNTLYILSDNLGRLNHSAKMGEPKGIYGPIYEGRAVALSKALNADKGTEKSMELIDWISDFDGSRQEHITYTFVCDGEEELYLRLELNCCVQVSVNGCKIAEFQNPNRGYGECVIERRLLQKGDNTVEITAYVSACEEAIREIALTALIPLRYSLDYCQWSQTPEDSAENNGGEFPVWYLAKPQKLSRQMPAFIKLPEGIKGQLYINGHNLGRIWSGIPQDTYYIPECWVGEENIFLLFCENAPDSEELISSVSCEREFRAGDNKDTEQYDVC